MDLSKLTNKVAAVVIADGKMLVFQGKDNKIAADLVRSSGLLDAFERYRKYS
jgi:hypothetical protein